MITFVRGILVQKKPTSVIVDVRDVGYEVVIPTSTYERLPAKGSELFLLTVHHVREDNEALFGFGTEAEREIFRTLVRVSGIGPRIALAALSTMRPQQIRDYIVNGEIGMIVSIPGIGKKTAERMVVELRDKFEHAMFASGNGSVSAESSARSDALAALEALGLSKSAAEKNLNKALRNNPSVETAEEMIRLALRDG